MVDQGVARVARVARVAKVARGAWQASLQGGMQTWA